LSLPLQKHVVMSGALKLLKDVLPIYFGNAFPLFYSILFVFHVYCYMQISLGPSNFRDQPKIGWG
jgi:hypothetical protein